jgi:hypothetical protein
LISTSIKKSPANQAQTIWDWQHIIPILLVEIPKFNFQDNRIGQSFMKSKLNKPMKRTKHMRTKPIQIAALKAIVSGGMTLTAAALLIFTACSTATPPPPPEGQSTAAFQKGVPGGVIVNTVDVSARVTAIDKAKRKVTLLAPDGEKYTVKVGPEAVNFDQIRVGDLVKAAVTEELVVYLEEEGTPSSEGAAGVVALAPKGAKPGGLVAQTRQVIATVTAIDRTKRTATLRFDDGTTKTFPVREDIDLSRHEVGERVVFRVTEMIAISVEKQ